MGINTVLLLVLLVLFVLDLIRKLRQQSRSRLAMPIGQPLRNGDLWEWQRLLVQIENVRRPV